MLVTTQIYKERVDEIKNRIDYSEYKYDMSGGNGCPIYCGCECFRLALGSKKVLYISKMAIEDHYDEIIASWLDAAIKLSNEKNQDVTITNKDGVSVP
jgi:hypothetical protein